jgi:hypothetical protein
MKYIKLFEYFNDKDIFENITEEDIYEELITTLDVNTDDLLDEDKYKRESKEIYDVFEELYKLVEINIYRAIKSKSIENIDLEDPGDYWSWSKESAISFSERVNKGNFLLKGKIKSQDVKWWNSIKSYIQFSHFHDPYESENELTVNSFEVYSITIEEIN